MAVAVKDGRFVQYVRVRGAGGQAGRAASNVNELRWTLVDSELTQESLLHDAVEIGSLAEGYRELADESLALAEESMAATFEALPRD
jgi:hypothetical protein